MPKPVTYVIQRGLDGPIKIGHSQDPAARLRQLQTASAETLYLLGVIDDEALENELHADLADDRLEGEWFRPSLNVSAFLDIWGIEIGVPCGPPPPAPLVERPAMDPTRVTWGGYMAMVRLGAAPPPPWRPERAA